MGPCSHLQAEHAQVQRLSILLTESLDQGTKVRWQYTTVTVSDSIRVGEMPKLEVCESHVLFDVCIRQVQREARVLPHMLLRIVRTTKHTPLAGVKTAVGMACAL